MSAMSRAIRALGGGPASRRNLSVAPSKEAPAAAAAVLAGRKAGQRDPGEDGSRVQWVFLGCPGVGKGTYAGRLSRLLGVPHIATGDLVRDALASQDPLSKQLAEIVNHGKLVSDEIIINLLSKRLEEGEEKGELGFILDGFPRTIRQAEILEGVTDIDLVINLKLREEALLAKCIGRRKCSQCGGNFNVASIDIEGVNGGPRMYMPPLLPPPECESKLITRADDTEEVVKERLRVYHDLCEPVEDFYRARGKLLEFNLPGGIPESWPKLLQALNIEDPDNKRSAAA
ncbi:probable adenylate kinase 6, chloroplastic [Lolium rigidum]|uniref:probable adenylate kinase 6, chloroplastic n=1 Tax=Lolium rigidum TaxID=89674 RepID=UPI001F5C3FCD|nr:probable adenylate kinase 6, chloroplastic [Lolium rigidum]